MADPAVVMATGVRADRHREVLGCSVGDNETEAFWTEFLTDPAVLIEHHGEWKDTDRRYLSEGS